MGKLERKNCNVTQGKNRRVAGVLANMTGPLTTTIKSVCCNHSFHNGPGWNQDTEPRLLKSEQREQQKEEHTTGKEVNVLWL